SAAEPGTILISHNTYRHVRGVFDVQPRDPITVKGVEGPVQTYVVLRAKPRAFRMATRGVEGIETRMIGRDSELGLLREAYSDALEAGETSVVTVVGEAGVGKSRLLYEFNNWLELRPETIRYFKGRATPNLQNVPYSLFRDLFAFRFQILDSDTAAVALDKFRAGMAGVLEADQADVVGHWLGFDFSASEAVQGLLGGADFGVVARAHLTRYVRMLAVGGPVLLFLEDIHWADDSSLDLAARLAETLPEAHLLVVALTRPSLFERRPHWGEGRRAFKRVNLTPLSRRASQELVNEILRRADNVPDSLRDLVVGAAEGNPFYVEELIKMLIDQGVIERGGAGVQGSGGAGEHEALLGNSFSPAPLPTRSPALEERWHIRAEKLADVKVPPTLTGLLQARLDGLPQPEREALQRAAVVGRLFWDDAVADLSYARGMEVGPALEAVRDRELIFRRERSSFAEANEYVFKHALLRDVAYETVLLRYRAEFHGRVARWLEAHAGERIGEYLGLIAEHFVQAGEFGRAADYQQQSGEQALRASAFRPARAAFERALALRERTGAAPGESLAHYLKLGEVCFKLSDFPAAAGALERALALARAGGDVQAQAEALSWTAMVATSVGRVAEVDDLLAEALALARQVGGVTLARVLINLATRRWQVSDLDAADQYANEAVRLARELGDVSLEIGATRAMGVAAGIRRDFDNSIRHFETCIALARQIGDRAQESKSQANLGATKQYAGDFAGAVAHYRASFEVDQELGMTEMMAIDAHNLADAYSSLNQLAESRRFAVECIRLARQVGAVPLQLAALVPLAEVMLKEGETGRALALLGLARQHPSTPNQKQVGINDALATVTLEPAEVEAKLAAGAGLELDDVVTEILGGE
ncbi:AAA family ATPase, partial [Promineifilum sp.]|uniref:ATP-binding protein n=1 Tax=Promineifilum sp. TaxID=2664178 RepID=UPI0035AF7B87